MTPGGRTGRIVQEGLALDNRRPMTTVDDLAFLRVALREKQIDTEHLRRAYIYLRAGRSRRPLPRLLFKNKLLSRELGSQLLALAEKEVGSLAEELEAPEQIDEILRGLARPLERQGDLSGMRLGLCILGECVGCGGEARVFRAHHVAWGANVVIKILLPGTIRKGTILDRLQREIELTSRLQHPAIARVFDFDVESVLPYVVHEYVDGETLQARIERLERLEPEELFSLGLQIAQGLQAAHEGGLLHRDIKPSNLMVSHSGKIKIIDFGFARDLTVPGHITATGFIVGTPYYTAPEYGLEDEVDARADLYSLGVTLFFALTGTLPYESRSLVRLLAMHLQEEVPKISERLPDAPPRLCAIIEKLLAKQPEQRFATAKELAEALQEPDLLRPPDAGVLRASTSAIRALRTGRRGPQTRSHHEPIPPSPKRQRPQAYDHIPSRLLEVYEESDEDEAEELPRRFFYPGSGREDDGLQEDVAPSWGTLRPIAEQAKQEPVPEVQAPTIKLIPLDEAMGTKGPSAEPAAKKGKPAPTAKRNRSGRIGRASRGSDRKGNRKLAKKLAAVGRPSRRTPAIHEEPQDGRVYCAACEEPIRKAKKILGNIVCLDCAEQVRENKICTACFGNMPRSAAKAKRTVIFRKGGYCPPCVSRVILYCAHCRSRFPLSDFKGGGAQELEGKPYCANCVPARDGDTDQPEPSRPSETALGSAAKSPKSGPIKRRRRGAASKRKRRR